MKKFLCLISIICLAVFFSACSNSDDTLSPTRVSITLDLDGGEIEGGLSHTAIIGENLELSVPTKYGFDFVGWKYNDAFVSLTPFTIEEYAVTLKAVWAVSPCTITVDLDGGAFEDGEPLIYRVHVGNNAGIPTPVKAGYEFEGWYYNSGKIELNPFNVSDVYSMTIKAKWSVKTYTVNFDFNGGKAVVDNQEVNSYASEQVFDRILDFPKPKKDGYVLAGWKVNGNLYEDLVWNLDVENATFVAQWAPSSIGYLFDLDGGAIDSEGGQIVFGSSTQSISELCPTKVGYNFAGWEVNGESLSDVWNYYSTENSKITLLALWTPKTYAVTLNAGEGSLQVGNEANVLYGQENILPIPTPSGDKNFVGWKIDSIDKIISSPSGLVVYNYDYAGELTAVYDDKQYAIFVNVDGSIVSIEVSVENMISEEDIPYPKSVKGYEVKWDIPNYEITSINQTTEIRAVIVKPFKFVAEFWVTGGKFNLDYNYGEQITLPNEDFVDNGVYKVRKAGYEFLGWTLTQGDTENYFNQTIWKFAKTTTFYPVYKPKTFVVTYDYSNIKVESLLYSGNYISNNKQEITYNSNYLLYTLKVAEDLVEVEWVCDGTTIPNSGIWAIARDVTLVAKIKENSYKEVSVGVNIDLNGGSGKPFGTIVLGKKLSTLSGAPTPPNDYKLIGYKYKDKTYLLNNIWDVLDYDGTQLIAQYEALPKTITVNINLNGKGTGSTKATIQVGEKLSKLSPKPVADNGYALIGFTYKGKFYSLNDVWDVEDYDGSRLIAEYEEDDEYWGPIIPSDS